MKQIEPDEFSVGDRVQVVCGLPDGGLARFDTHVTRVMKYELRVEHPYLDGPYGFRLTDDGRAFADGIDTPSTLYSEDAFVDKYEDN